MRAVPLLVAAIGALAISGCGGSEGSGEGAASRESDEVQIGVLTERFGRILEARDTAAFCRVLAPNDVHKLGGGESNGKKECMVVWGPKRNPLFGAEAAELAVESLSFEGPYATAQLTNGGELAFAKEGGRWYVHLMPEKAQTRGVGS